MGLHCTLFTPLATPLFHFNETLVFYNALQIKQKRRETERYRCFSGAQIVETKSQLIDRVVATSKYTKASHRYQEHDQEPAATSTYALDKF